MIPLHANLLLEHEYTVVEINDRTLVHDWLVESFGNPGTRWFYNGNKIYYRDERDWMWFELST